MWTCTSSGAGADLGFRRARTAGMTLLELLVGMTLTLVLAAAVVPVWLSLQAQTIASGDHVVSLLQSRVAVGPLGARCAAGHGRGAGLLGLLVDTGGG